MEYYKFLEYILFLGFFFISFWYKVQILFLRTIFLHLFFIIIIIMLFVHPLYFEISHSSLYVRNIRRKKVKIKTWKIWWKINFIHINITLPLLREEILMDLDLDLWT